MKEKESPIEYVFRKTDGAEVSFGSDLSLSELEKLPEDVLENTLSALKSVRHEIKQQNERKI